MIIIGTVFFAVVFRESGFSDFDAITQGRIVGITIGIVIATVITPLYYVLSDQGIDIRWALFRLRFVSWDHVQQVGIVFRQNQNPTLIIVFDGCPHYNPKEDYELFKLKHFRKCILIGHIKNIEERVAPYCGQFDFKVNW